MDGELAEAKVVLVEYGRIVLKVASVDATVRLNVAGHTIHNGGEGGTGAGSVRVVVNDILANDMSLIHWPDTLVPMDMSGEIGVDVEFDEKRLEELADSDLIRGFLRAVHWTMSHGEDPWSFLAVNAHEIMLQPVPLLVGFVFSPISSFDLAEWAAVSRISLFLSWQVLVRSSNIADERPFRTEWEVGFAVDGDEVRVAVVETIPKVADALGLVARHAEAVLICCEVP